MENSISSSYKAGLYRILGTLVGAFVGVIAVYIKPGDAFLMGIGILVLIFICNSLKWDRSVAIAGVVFSSIMLSLNNKDPLKYSFNRVNDTFIGIVIAVAVNYLIYPPNNLKQMRKSLDDIKNKISDAIVDFVCLRKNVDLSIINREVINSIKYLESYNMEFKPNNKDNDYSLVNKELESLRSILSHLSIISELGPGCCLNSENHEKLSKLNLCNLNTEEYEDNSQNIIYNYHVGKILDALPHLSK